MTRNRILFLLIIFVFTLALPVFAQESGEVTHVVQPGENLFRIALRYGVDMNELAAANGITDPTRIYVGQVLVIPGLSSPDSGDVVENPLVAAAPIIHTVQRGPGFSELPAVEAGRVWIADGNAYFNRPGPRLVESAEIVAAALHPDVFGDRFPHGADALRRWP